MNSAEITELRRKMPYGRWITATGCEVLFNRGYAPLWKRTHGQQAQRCLWEWVRDIKREEWFWDGSRTPWSNADTLRKMRALLDSWGVG